MYHATIHTYQILVSLQFVLFDDLDFFNYANSVPTLCMYFPNANHSQNYVCNMDTWPIYSDTQYRIVRVVGCFAFGQIAPGQLLTIKSKVQYLSKSTIQCATFEEQMFSFFWYQLNKIRFVWHQFVTSYCQSFLCTFGSRKSRRTICGHRGLQLNYEARREATHTLTIWS